MKHYTVKEYVKRYNQHPDEKYMNDYLLSLAKGSDLSEMIEFREPYFLAGAFSGKFGLLTIQNYLKYDRKELQTQAESLQSYLRFSEGVHSIDNLIKPKNITGVFISGGYDKKTGLPVKKESYNNNTHRFFVEKMDDRTSTLNHPYIEEHVCSKSDFRSSELLSGILEALKNNKTEDVIHSIEKTLLNMDNMTKNFFTYDTDAYPTYEKPYKLYIAGTDDSSWSMCYPTMEEALAVRKAILEDPCSATIHKYLAFTN